MVYLAAMLGVIVSLIAGALWMKKRQATERERVAVALFNERMATLQAKVMEGHKHVR